MLKRGLISDSYTVPKTLTRSRHPRGQIRRPDETQPTTRGMDKVRHNSDSEAKYKSHFHVVHLKMEKYGIEARHTYNMDEKGFAIGKINSTKRIFSRRQWEKKEVTLVIQDGSKEWVSVVACICADGEWVPPGIIFEAEGGNIRDN